jgi:membrane protease YdiL (CAAX protease family)
MDSAEEIAPRPRTLIAPVWHTLLLLVFLTIPVVLGILAQRHAAQQAALRTSFLAFALPTLAFQWFLAFFVWIGLRLRKVPLRQIIGGRWINWRDLWRDVVLALGLVAVLAVIGILLPKVLSPDHAKSISTILPKTPSEFAIWVVIAMTAGIVEELIFRGYLQTQFARFGLPALLAIVAQAALFAAGHSYEGRNAMIVILIYGVLLGLLARWRKSLRPNMIGHATLDTLAAVSALFG